MKYSSYAKCQGYYRRFTVCHISQDIGIAIKDYSCVVFNLVYIYQIKIKDIVQCF